MNKIKNNTPEFRPEKMKKNMEKALKSKEWLESFTTVRSLVHHLPQFKGKCCLSDKKAKEKREISFHRVYSSALNIAKGLLNIGLQPGDRVALFAENIPEWLIISLGINAAGLVDVPRGENSSPAELNYIVEHSQARVVIVENEQFYNIISQKEHHNLKECFSINPVKGLRTVGQLEKFGADSPSVLPELKPDDLCSIIYTSGTTAIPKGVELTHKNFMSNLNAVNIRLDLSPEDKLISVLPAWHVFERIAKYTALSNGCETFYSTVKNLKKDLMEQKPSAMVSVPRIWENIHNTLMRKIRKSHFFTKTIVSLGINASMSAVSRKWYSPLKWLELPLFIMTRNLVFDKLRESLGNNLRFAVSGGSSLPAYVDDFFRAAQIEIIEGYGLTETSPVISARVYGGKNYHTVGPLLDNIEAKIINPETGEQMSAGEQGVLFVKGPSIMKGYFRNFSETDKVLHDGWLNTGDLAYFDKYSNLVITGREKEIIVLSSGENINPVPLETRLRKSDYIATAVVVGQEWKRIGALIDPDIKNLEQYCKENKILFSSNNIAACLNNPKIRDLYACEIDKFVNKLHDCQPFQRIQAFRILQYPLRIGYEITPTLKLKRSHIEKTCRVHIESMSDELC
jgi:long-chain acyl-CoA synthetase